MLTNMSMSEEARKVTPAGATVIDRNGVRGTIEIAAAAPPGASHKVLVRFRDRATVLVDSSLLVPLEDGTYLLPESLDELRLRARDTN